MLTEARENPTLERVFSNVADGIAERQGYSANCGYILAFVDDDGLRQYILAARPSLPAVLNKPSAGCADGVKSVSRQGTPALTASASWPLKVLVARHCRYMYLESLPRFAADA
jgi:hypothetical protein